MGGERRGALTLSAARARGSSGDRLGVNRLSVGSAYSGIAYIGGLNREAEVAGRGRSGGRVKGRSMNGMNGTALEVALIRPAIAVSVRRLIAPSPTSSAFPSTTYKSIIANVIRRHGPTSAPQAAAVRRCSSAARRSLSSTHSPPRRSPAVSSSPDAVTSGNGEITSS